MKKIRHIEQKFVSHCLRGKILMHLKKKFKIGQLGAEIQKIDFSVSAHLRARHPEKSADSKIRQNSKYVVQFSKKKFQMH